MMDVKVWRQRREGMMREAQQDRLAQALRDSRKRRDAGQSLSPIWKIRRRTDRLRNPLATCEENRLRRQPQPILYNHGCRKPSPPPVPPLGRCRSALPRIPSAAADELKEVRMLLEKKHAVIYGGRP